MLARVFWKYPLEVRAVTDRYCMRCMQDQNYVLWGVSIHLYQTTQYHIPEDHCIKETLCSTEIHSKSKSVPKNTYVLVCMKIQKYTRRNMLTQHLHDLYWVLYTASFMGWYFFICLPTSFAWEITKWTFTNYTCEEFVGRRETLAVQEVTQS